ncbi:hypothetical protein KGM_206990 [Danaus plexippus plexippus]|uniref:Uncharacterized protein n=1 Tax=Danaus plexippus plexippus TaxID=278856 RepID=A0A212FN21_DANPL|nr:hypothetical protein KGM_206990 [Danaus plexippus plexippus]
MHLKDQHPLYPCSESDKQEIRRELGMKESILQEDIDAILDWFNKQAHLVHAPIDRDHIEKLLISTNGSREKTKRRIDNFYKYRSQAPELVLSRREVLTNPLYNGWSFYHQAAMFELYEKKRISIFKITDPDPSKFDADVIFRNTIMLGDLRLKFDYMLGEIWIMDLENVSFGHILRVNPTTIQKFMNIIQDGVGFKMFEIHFINVSSFGQHVVNFLKQFVKPKIMERFVCHENSENLHKYIPKKYLPKDYGGEQPSLNDMKAILRKELLKDLSKNYLLECCQQLSDESKRMGTKYQEEHLVGSFKKLEFD